MLKDYINNCKDLDNLNKEFNKFCLSKYIDTNDINKKIKENLKEILKKDIYKDYKDINFYTSITYYSNHEINNITFYVSYNYNIDLLKFELKKSYCATNNIDKKINMFLSNDNFKINTLNQNILNLKAILNEIINKIENVGMDLIQNKQNENYLFLKNIKEEYFEKETKLLNEIWFNKVEENKFNNLLKEIISINLNDYEYKLYLYKNIINEDICFSLTLFPKDLLKNSTISLFVVEYNELKDKYKITNKFIKNSNLLKENIDINKNLKKMNKYILDIFKK